MAVTRVNFVEGANWTGTTGTSYASPAQAVTAGNTLVTSIGFFNHPGAVTGVTDTAGNSYTKVTHVYNPSDQYRQEIWVATAVAGHASNVVTAALSIAVSFRGICVAQYSGLGTAVVDDTQQTVANPPGATPTLTSTSAESVHMLMTRWGYGTTGFPAGFTKFSTGGGSLPEVADKIVTGSFSGTYTLTSANWFALAAIIGAGAPAVARADTFIWNPE